MTGRKYISQDEFERRLSEIGSELVIMEPYRGRFVKIRVKDELNIEYMVTPDKLYEGKKPGFLTAINPDLAFAIRARKIHSDRYSYEFVKYKNDRNKIDILCLEHGLFSQIPSSHLQGSGCPQCSIKSSKQKYAKNGFSRTAWIKYCNNEQKTPKLYVLKCSGNEREFIKIGITTRAINKRFWKTNMPYEYEIIYVSSGGPEYVYDKEKELHKKYKAFKYIPKIRFDGYRECFTCEIENTLGTGVQP